MGVGGYTHSRVISQEYFDTIKLRARLITIDNSLYDDIMDEKIERLVLGTVSRFFRSYADRHDVMQDIKFEVYKRITHYLSSPKCNSKEQLEKWICVMAKWKCLNYMKRQKYDQYQYLDEISALDITNSYEGADQEKMNEYISYIWNLNTPPPKSIFFILRRFLEPDSPGHNYDESLDISGAEQRLACKYAAKKISCTTDESNALEFIVRHLGRQERTAFSDAVNALDSLLEQSGLQKAPLSCYRKIVSKLNTVENGAKPGNLTLAETVRLSKTNPDSLTLRYDTDGQLHLDKTLIKHIADYITKGTYRIQNALMRIATEENQREKRQ